jgi:large subunit ribosomal protein L29
MKTTEMREMTLAELAAHAAELAEELARMRMQLALKRLDNPLKARTTRRALARAKTIMNEKMRAGAAATAGPADTGTTKA